MKYLPILALISAPVFADSLEVTWDPPILDEAGEALTDPIDGYNVYYSKDNGSQAIVNVTDPYHLIENISIGSYAIQVASVYKGLESEKSDPFTLAIDEISSKPAKVKIRVQLICDGPCGVKVQ